ncbi:MAG: hypothetical protein ACTSPB_13015 [Candidatus Thorarchaeota archaeon]
MWKSKGASLPINTVVLLVIGSIVLVLLVLFVQGAITRESGGLSEQKIWSECCTRACNNPNNFASDEAVSRVICATSSQTSAWAVVGGYNTQEPNDQISLAELAQARIGSSTPATVANACGCPIS